MMYTSILQAIGNTPLIRLLVDTPAQVYAKLEYLNPSGSIKDRAALFMIEEAERLGTLKPGGTIIEASSGNQGISAAMIGAAKGYKVIITCSDKVSKEKRDGLKAYGAELITCPATLHLDNPQSYHQKALEIQRNTPNSFMLNQYFNQDNATAHYVLTGPEIWKQTQGAVTHFVAAAGSCGTLSGTGKFLKEQNPNIRILGVDAATSYRSTAGNPKPYKIEGLGIDYETPLMNKAVIDDFLTCTDDDAFAMLKQLARKQGLLVGPAGAAAAHAACQYARNLNSNDIVVLLFTDSGRSYLTKGYYD